MSRPLHTEFHYLRPKRAPRWLSVGEVVRKYRNPEAFHEFVLSGNEGALVKFYSTKRHAPVLGSEEFVEWARAGAFSFGSYGSVGGACRVIERQIKEDGKLRCRIERIRETASLTSSQTKTLFHFRALVMKHTHTASAFLVSGLMGGFTPEYVETIAGVRKDQGQQEHGADQQ
jgi:hypothetical protein